MPSSDNPSGQRIEQAFAYCPRCGTPNATPGSIPFQCGDCGLAIYFGPVAAVGGLVVDEQNRLLLVRRARDPGKHQWGLPGGFVDRGETAYEALAREIQEETQLILCHHELLTTGPNLYTHTGATADVLDMFFVCRVVATHPVELAASELCEYRWCVPDEEILGNMAFPSNRIAVELWLSRRVSDGGAPAVPEKQ
ncbi:NUDIX hydrolase [Allorhodopirellula solitaria]|uniref:Bifunctional nicotinamide mononucleotide adenylyltransferase/ADP-ribose pyrophosphatase n=1 Tax=Allorhodopirellula solitaria TaxID=2527987 RepID=A0A5C5YGY0_9BACT|nr:NUDIX domain-containing protein [Allorhodopirellula solitaria]TWT74243.1 bifunctional nicotinamide mononucleotide adenylyltransferase/ADP-ribose pyrophosphatase [Allorhodopirellula solitaria]